MGDGGMTITSKDLDCDITIRRYQQTGTDPLNTPIYDWADFITDRAKRRDASSREKFAAGQVGASLSTYFVVRSSPETRTITPEDRLVHEGRTYNITDVKEANEGRLRFLEITAVTSNEPLPGGE